MTNHLTHAIQVADKAVEIIARGPVRYCQEAWLKSALSALLQGIQKPSAFSSNYDGPLWALDEIKARAGIGEGE
jgi:hypothetical protein